MDFGAPEASLPAIIAGYAMLVVVALLASGLAARFLDRRRFASLGLGFHSRWARELGAGCGLGVLFIAVVIGTELALGAIRLESSGVETSQLIRQGILYLVLFVGVAFVEELLFRGYALQTLAEGIGPVPAAFLASAPFGFIHYFNDGGTIIGALSTGVAGLLLCLAYFRTRSLWLPVGLHITWNFTMGVVWGQPVSGENLGDVAFRSVSSGPDWLTGGPFGPEGSALAFVGMTLMAVWIARARFFDASPEASTWYPPPEERVAARDEAAASGDEVESDPNT